MKRIWASKSTIGFHLLIYLILARWYVYTFYRLDNYFVTINWKDFFVFI